jgi:hypothetical protein
VNCKHRILEDRRPSVEARIRYEVDAHVRPDRNQSAQRVQTANEKIVFFQESREGTGRTWGRRGGSVHFSFISTA